MLHRMLLPFLGSLLLLSRTIDAQVDVEVVRFNFRFGFFDDELTPKYDIMKDDVEGVVCQTQYFMSQLVQNATGSKSVHAKATNITWGTYQADELPVHVNFTVEFSDAMMKEDDVNWVDDRILITQMEALGTPGLQKYITDWVWKAEPIDLNYFTNANRMAFDGVKMPPVKGQMEEAECPETDAPTILPTISPAPSIASSAPTLAPTRSVFGGVGKPGSNDPNATNPNATDPNSAGGPDGADGDGNGDPSNPNGAGGELTPAPNGDNPVGPGGALSRANWPFGPNYNALDDLEPMADFSLSFAMFEKHENPPSSAEVNALICQVNEFFTKILRQKLHIGTIHVKGVFVDWFFDEGGAGTDKEDIRVNFTAFAYIGQDEHEQVPVKQVFDSMKLTDAELKDFVENYVWRSEPRQENVFFHTESLSLDYGTGTEPDKSAMLIEADGCVLPLNDDGTPFEGIYGPGGPEGQEFSGTPAAAGANPTDTNGASVAVDPTSLGFEADAKQSKIVVNFRVSNLEGIKEEGAVRASGLQASFPVFTNELVNELTARDAARRFLGKGRRLRVVVVPESSTVDDINEYPCPASALPGLTCHSARAKYDVLMSSDEDPARINPDYTAASETAANDGTYNNVLQRVDPDTPLYIGIMTSTDQIPPGSKKRGYDGEDDDDDSWFKWWYLLILLLLLLLCCLCCLFCWMNNQKDDPKNVSTTVEERDVLVEEFEDEDEPEGGARKDGDDDEEFVDDPAGAGVMVPFNPSGQPPPDAGVMVAYDPDKAKRDAAERERILNESSQRGDNSQRGEYSQRGLKKKEEDDDQVWEED